MNKEREEQMRKAAWEYAEENGVDCSHDMTCIDDFCAGWRAADSHHNWIPVEERLPKRMSEKSRFSETVLVYNEEGYKDTAYYDYEEKIWRWMPRVTHWMPMPAAPRGGVIIAEQEMQFELIKSQEIVNALRQEVAEMNKEREYWQHYRIHAAIAAMQGMLANPAYHKAQVESGEPFGYFYAMNAIMCADVLIAELQKKGENENDD